MKGYVLRKVRGSDVGVINEWVERVHFCRGGRFCKIMYLLMDETYTAGRGFDAYHR